MSKNFLLTPRPEQHFSSRTVLLFGIFYTSSQKSKKSFYPNLFFYLCTETYSNRKTSHRTNTMYTIQLNEKGSRHLDISDDNLKTIQKYHLFRDLVDSHGYVTEDVLTKLRMTVRALIAQNEKNTKDLLDLCIDVIYHNDMKALGLHNLILLFIDWEQNHPSDTDEQLPPEVF